MSKQEVPDGVQRAAERVTLACRALSAAADELRRAQARTKIATVDAAASMLDQETERVCELAEDLAILATNLNWSAVAVEPAD